MCFVVHGLQVLRLRHPEIGEEATGVDLPRYRTSDGAWRQAHELPAELGQPIGDAVLERCCEMGVTRH